MFRGYAVRSTDRSYRPGPALPRKASLPGWIEVVARWHPVVEDVAARTGETAHVIVRDDATAVFLDSVVSDQALTVGSRIGTRLPAERNSGGKVLLAQLAPAAIASLYAQRSDVDLGALADQLLTVRRQGFALSSAESERGITAVSVQAREEGTPPVAITVSGPSMRFNRRRALSSLTDLRQAIADAANS